MLHAYATRFDVTEKFLVSTKAMCKWESSLHRLAGPIGCGQHVRRCGACVLAIVAYPTSLANLQSRMWDPSRKFPGGRIHARSLQLAHEHVKPVGSRTEGTPMDRSSPLRRTI